MEEILTSARISGAAHVSYMEKPPTNSRDDLTAPMVMALDGGDV